jgi:hypothetical protein
LAQPQTPRPGIRISLHGLVGTVLVVGAVSIAVLRRWEVPWLYFVLAMLLYFAAVLVISQPLGPLGSGSGSSTPRLMHLQAMYAAHLSFLFLILGLLIPFDGFWVGCGIFVVSIAAGCAIPLILIREQ